MKKTLLTNQCFSTLNINLFMGIYRQFQHFIEASLKSMLLWGICLFMVTGYAQMSMVDSTAQAIAYWDKGEKQSYGIAYDKISLKGTDTINKYTIDYKLDITVTDSTATSYTIACKYYDYKITGNNPSQVGIKQKVVGLREGLTVLVKTDEMGAFEELMNWEEVTNFIDKTVKEMIIETDDPMIQKAINQAAVLYNSKAAVENTAIKDIKQILFFNGVAYTLNEEQKFDDKAPNIIDPSKPFDSHLTLSMIDMYEEDNTFILKANTEIDKDQLTEATLQYINKQRLQAKQEPLTKDEIGTLQNETHLYTEQHVSGWVVSSLQTITVTTNGSTAVEQRYIKIL